jgi:hypothetical protein
VSKGAGPDSREEIGRARLGHEGSAPGAHFDSPQLSTVVSFGQGGAVTDYGRATAVKRMRTADATPGIGSRVPM